jgi:hypothetical protein
VSSIGQASTLPGLVAARLLDAQLAGLVGLLLERGVPMLLAGSDVASAAAVLDALVGALPPDRRPDAAEPGAAGRLVRVAGTLAPGSVPGVFRAALGATTGRSGLAALVDARDIEGVLDVLARQGMTDDEASFLGVVIVVDRPAEAGGEPRVTSAHYLRPLVRDAAGHTRRLRPAVLATWVPGGDRWEDFAWGIGPDLAERCRMRPGEFEAERERRAALFAGQAAAGDGATDDPAAGRAPTGPVPDGPVG